MQNVFLVKEIQFLFIRPVTKKQKLLTKMNQLKASSGKINNPKLIIDSTP